MCSGVPPVRLDTRLAAMVCIDVIAGVSLSDERVEADLWPVTQRTVGGQSVQSSSSLFIQLLSPSEDDTQRTGSICPESCETLNRTGVCVIHAAEACSHDNEDYYSYMVRMINTICV